MSPREILQKENSVLVHFSTVMSSHPEHMFPEDMKNACKLKGVPLAFSTIRPGDVNCFTGADIYQAEGSIGLLVDIGTSTVIMKVGSSDIGSSREGSLGLDPTDLNCINSIVNRNGSNEWHIQDFVPVGILLMPPLFVRKNLEDANGDLIPVDVPVTMPEVLTAFPNCRIFSPREKNFWEYNRTEGRWVQVTYENIFKTS